MFDQTVQPRFACTALLFFVAIQQVSQAEAQAPTALSWVRMEGAESCIALPELAERVERHVGNILEPLSQAEVMVDGHIAPTAHGYEAVIDVTGRDGRRLGRKTLETQTADCSTVDEVLAFIIAVAVAPNAVLGLLPGAFADDEQADAAALSELVESISQDQRLRAQRERSQGPGSGAGDSPTASDTNSNQRHPPVRTAHEGGALALVHEHSGGPGSGAGDSPTVSATGDQRKSPRLIAHAGAAFVGDPGGGLFGLTGGAELSFEHVHLMLDLAVLSNLEFPRQVIGTMLYACVHPVRATGPWWMAAATCLGVLAGVPLRGSADATNPITSTFVGPSLALHLFFCAHGVELQVISQLSVLPVTTLITLQPTTPQITPEQRMMPLMTRDLPTEWIPVPSLVLGLRWEP